MMSQIIRHSLLACIMVSVAACHSGYQRTKKTSRITVKPSKDIGSMQSEHNMYTVRSGDTLYGISFKSGLNYRDVALWNNIEEPFTIQLGQKIRLSPANQDRDITIKPMPSSLPNVKPSLSKPLLISTLPEVKKNSPLSLSTITWQWPTKGELMDTYIAGDKTKQGVNIGGEAGQKILAAADGVVVYSGSGLIGYGELLIIKHNNEWISAYAHNAKRLVAEGSNVKAGQHIANMGRTGAAHNMLHFEIRRNGKPVDPLLYLPKP
jgi:lipoprotein NlpD